ALPSVAALLGRQIPRVDELSIDTRVLLFAVAASLVTGILSGSLPALRAGRTDLNETLKEGGRSDSAVGVRTRRLLIAGEVALSVVLLAGAGVMLRSLVALRSVDAGFDPRNVLTMRVSLPQRRYDTPQKLLSFFRDAPADVPGVLRRRAAPHPGAARRHGGGWHRRPAAAQRIGAADRSRGACRAAAARSADG